MTTASTLPTATRLLGGLALCLVSSMSISSDRIHGDVFATRSEVIATHGMAATSQPLATQVAQIGRAHV